MKNNFWQFKIMNRKTFITVLLLFCSWCLSAQDIVIRNTCITKCAYCSDSTSVDSTVFEYAKPLASSASVKFNWVFRKAGSDNSYSTVLGSSDKRTGSFKFCEKGDYAVDLYLNGSVVYLKYRFKIGFVPPIVLGQDSTKVDTTICKGDRITLRVKNPLASYSYLWFPKGETTDFISVDKSGCYSVKVTDAISGCSSEGNLQVIVCGEIPPPASPPDNTWYFGEKAGLNFGQGGTPTPKAGNPMPTTNEAIAKINDTKNNILLFSDGKKVYDAKLNDLIPGKSLAAESNSQGLVIIPKATCKGCQAEYYVIYTKRNSFNERQIFQSTIDFKLNGGRGGMSVEGSMLSATNTSTRMVSMPLAENSSLLFTQDLLSGNIRSFIISNTGISAPILSLSKASFLAASLATSTMKVSPNKQLLAISNAGSPLNKIELYNIDTLSGKVKHKVSISLGSSTKQQVYGLDFSKNNKLIYASLKGVGVADTSSIVQLDISANDSTTYEATRKTVPGSKIVRKIGAIQPDPVNGTDLYVAVLDQTSLGKITSIDGVVGTPSGASFTLSGAALPPGAKSKLGLPASYSVTSSDGKGISIKQSCFGLKYSYKLTGKLCDPIENTKVIWNIYKTTLNPVRNANGTIVPLNPATTQLFTFTGDSVNYAFSENGTYVVTAKVSNKCVTDSLLDAQKFEIDLLKPFYLAPEFSVICKNSTEIKADSLPAISGLKYFWSTNATTDKITVNKPGGAFDLTITDPASGCSLTKATKVNFTTNSQFDPPKDLFICDDNVNAAAFKENITFVELKLPVPASSLKSIDWAGIPSAANKDNVQVTQSGSYVCTIKDRDDCILTITYVVKDKCAPILQLPSAFTPNDDGSNDYFRPVGNFETVSSVSATVVKARTVIESFEIFNRWGEMIYSNSAIDSSWLGWDGKINGTAVPQNTYAYRLKYSSIDMPEMGVMELRGTVVITY
jgi:gliding motility-associated-like protein